MPISSHCFWPWLSAPAGSALALGEADASPASRRCARARSRRQAREQGPPGAAAVGEGQFEVLEHGQVLEHGRPLELAADAEIGDRRLVEPGQILVAAKEHFAGIGPGLAGDDIHHRRLAGAVGADDRAQLAFLDDERQLVQRLEPVEADRDAVRGRAGRRRSDARRGPRSCLLLRRDSVVAAGDRRRRDLPAPARAAQLPDRPDDAAREDQRRQHEQAAQHEQPRSPERRRSARSWPRLTSTAPRIAPTSVPRPPTDDPDRDLDRVAGRELARVDDADLRHVERAGDARRAPPRR